MVEFSASVNDQKSGALSVASATPPAMHMHTQTYGACDYSEFRAAISVSLCISNWLKHYINFLSCS